MTDNKPIEEQGAVSDLDQLKEQLADSGCGCGPACCGSSGGQGFGFRKFMFYGVILVAVGVAAFSML